MKCTPEYQFFGPSQIHIWFMSTFLATKGRSVENRDSFYSIGTRNYSMYCIGFQSNRIRVPVVYVELSLHNQLAFSRKFVSNSSLTATMNDLPFSNKTDDRW
jgi:hypothetical protein